MGAKSSRMAAVLMLGDWLCTLALNRLKRHANQTNLELEFCLTNQRKCPLYRRIRSGFIFIPRVVPWLNVGGPVDVKELFVAKRIADDSRRRVSRLKLALVIYLVAQPPLHLLDCLGEASNPGPPRGIINQRGKGTAGPRPQRCDLPVVRAATWGSLPYLRGEQDRALMLAQNQEAIFARSTPVKGLPL